jgi:formylmethanofuran dehydrogenase subunit E
MSWTDDPLADFYRHDAEQAAQEAQRPVCSVCGERIFDDVAYRVDGKLICESCMDEMRVYLD